MGERHNGIAGTGLRIVRTGDGIIFTVTASTTFTVSWFEMDGGGSANIITNAINFTASGQTVVTRNMIVHDLSTTFANVSGIRTGNPGLTVKTCILYNIANTTSTSGKASAIGLDTSATCKIFNCVIFGVEVKEATSTGDAFGIAGIDDSDHIIKNNIVMDTANAGSGEAKDYEIDSPSNAIMTYNSSSDTTASGLGSLTSQTASSYFENITAGSEDLHLKDGANALLAGLGPQSDPNVPTDDIDGGTRSGATTDMGADQHSTIIEFVSIGADEFAALVADGMGGQLLDAVPRSRRS